MAEAMRLQPRDPNVDGEYTSSGTVGEFRPYQSGLLGRELGCWAHVISPTPGRAERPDMTRIRADHAKGLLFMAHSFLGTPRTRDGRNGAKHHSPSHTRVQGSSLPVGCFIGESCRAEPHPRPASAASHPGRRRRPGSREVAAFVHGPRRLQEERGRIETHPRRWPDRPTSWRRKGRLEKAALERR